MTSIWDFAVDFYGRTGVPEACLALQDRGVEVTTLLAALYAAASGRPPLTAGDFARIEARVGTLQRDVIAKLRHARAAMKPMIADPAIARLRASVKRLELDAEKLILETIANALPAPASPAGSALANLAAYPACARLLDEPACQKLLEQLANWSKNQGV